MFSRRAGRGSVDEMAMRTWRRTISMELEGSHPVFVSNSIHLYRISKNAES